MEIKIHSINPDAMTDEQREFINRTIHEWRGKCWHELRKWNNVPIYKCMRCQTETRARAVNPDYTRNLNAMHEAEMEMKSNKHQTYYLDNIKSYLSVDNIDFTGKINLLRLSAPARALAMARSIKAING